MSGQRTRIPGCGSGRAGSGTRVWVCGSGRYVWAPGYVGPAARVRVLRSGCADPGKRDRVCGSGQTGLGMRIRANGSGRSGLHWGCAGLGAREYCSVRAAVISLEMVHTVSYAISYADERI